MVFCKPRHLGVSLRIRQFLSQAFSKQIPSDKHVCIQMIAFNASSTIGEAIDSIQNQLYEDWELVIVDDGSSDETVSLAVRWAQTDTRIHVLRHIENQGRGQARNTAISFMLNNLNFDVMAVIDSDDVANRDWLELGLTGIEQGAGAVRCLNGRYNADLSIHQFDYLACAQIFLRRSILEKLGGYRNAPYIEDHDYMERLERAIVLEKSFGLTTCRQAQKMRYHGQNMSQTVDKRPERVAAAKRSELDSSRAKRVQDLYVPFVSVTTEVLTS